MARDKNQCIQAAFDDEGLQFRTTVVGAATDPQPAHNLDSAQVWKRVFDPDTNSLRIVLVEA